jgi:gamma-glutamyltranspeptidase/glutathione hydrolase
MDLIEFNMTPQDAVSKPKFHHQWLPDILYVEKGFSATVLQELEKIGYKTKARESIGRTELIVVHAPGNITAVADKRGDDAASGY